MKNENVAKKHAGHGFTQFELTKIVLNNLKHYKLTPVGKLVLLVLVDCYNADNGNVVFPSIEFIADKIGCGLTATKQAINDLIKEGLVIKSKRSKINGNRNKYLLTPKVQNPTSERSQNEFFKQSDFDRFHEEQKREQKNNKVVDFKKGIKAIRQEGNRTETENILNSIPEEPELKLNNDKDLMPSSPIALLPNKNTYSLNLTDTKILENYAKKRGAKNVQAYISKLRETGADKRIIADYKAKRGAEEYAKNQIAQTAEMVKILSTRISEPPTESFKALRAKLLKNKHSSLRGSAYVC